jgi:tetratricopeptide (TPR) repeat protein
VEAIGEGRGWGGAAGARRVVAGAALGAALLAFCLGGAPSPPGSAAGLSTSNPRAAERFQKARSEADAKNWSSAVAELQGALALDPKFVDAYVLLGSVREEMRQFADAADCYEKALALKPEAHDVRLQLGFLMLARGMADRAESEARQVLKSDATDAAAYLLLGAVYRLKPETLPLAVEQYRRAVDLTGGKDPQCQALLGQTLLMAGRVPEGAEHLRVAAAMVPKDSLLLRQLATTYFQMQRYAEAFVLLRTIGAQDPKQRDVGLYEVIMRCAFLLGAYPDAMQLALAAEQAAPNNAQVLLFGGMVARFLGEPAEADQRVARAIAADPKVPEGDYIRGLLRLDAGRLPEAIDSFRRAVEAAPRDAGASYQLGMAYARAGMTAERDKALATFRRLKEAEQAAKEAEGIEAGLPDQLRVGPPPASQPTTSQAATRP